jgi:nicotinamide phosphoribosyltransferase
MNTQELEQLFAPQQQDQAYTQTDQLRISLICRVDSYKFSHHLAYPRGIEAMTSYGEARMSPTQTIVPFGMQMLVKRYLNQTITMADVDAAEQFALAHFGRPLFDRAAWERVVTVYGGKLPLIIRSVPEGTVMRGGQPIYTVTCLDPICYWMSAGFETMIQRGIWYPTTIATRDREVKQRMRDLYQRTGADLNLLPFALHDFGGRGVSCAEQAEIGGAAHLVNFMGSDTVEGVLAANFYYKNAMSAFSVYATEHAIECSWGGGEADAPAYIAHQLANAPKGSIISIVIDGYDVFREAHMICTQFRDQIVNSGVKVVFRPDSGDMMEVVPRILAMQQEAFGFDVTDKGYKRIRNVGIIQGDGVDSDSLIALLTKMAILGYSADCVVFGSGGSLLMKVNRDTLSFAQKASAILINGEWKGVAKDPITDHGKKSKEGILTLARNAETGELKTVRLDQAPITSPWQDVMQLVYHKGQLFNEVTLEEVRARVA